jgi:enoyl-CoA hydratase/carnithine racemase
VYDTRNRALAGVRRRLLTGDEFDAAEALRIGLVQEVVEPGDQLDRAAELAERIATRSAPLAVSTTLAAAQRANREGERAAEDRFVDDVVSLFNTKDGAEGMLSFLERRPARFIGV